MRAARTAISPISSTANTAGVIVPALSNALSTGPSLAVREARRALAQQVLAHQGITITVPLPPAQGFDWAGTITPAVFAVLLIGLIAVLAARIRRA